MFAQKSSATIADGRRCWSASVGVFGRVAERNTTSETHDCAEVGFDLVVHSYTDELFSLLHLHASQNHIGSIDEDFFVSLPKLRTLNISHNHDLLFATCAREADIECYEEWVASLPYVCFDETCFMFFFC